MNQTQTFELQIGSEIIAVIQTTMFEFPWWHGEIVSFYNFEQYRPYFDEDEIGEWIDTEEGENICSEIDKKGFSLINIETQEKLENPTLHYNGGCVCFR